MLVVLISMALGIIAGYILRNRKMKHLGRFMIVIIWLLLFLLGVEAGSNERIVRWIASLGMEAFVISLGGIVGSSVFALLLWKFSQNRKGAESEG